ncbi:MAG: T9SS type A sorting domain-containing protein [Chitinophagales bacterium]|nr:T9SS type A sorting domain-containing protein [Chitinophagales bacterium]
MKSLFSVIAILLLSLQVCTATQLKSVKVLNANNDSITLEVVASFSFGSGSFCPVIHDTTSTINGNVLNFSVYYDISEAFPANHCIKTDTLTLEKIPQNIKEIRISMYGLFIYQPPPQVDTYYYAPDWSIFLPLSVDGNEQSLPDTHIYPNPNNGRFVIENSFTGQTGAVKLDIVNAMGQVVYSESVMPANNYLKKTIDLAESPPGIYTLRLHRTEGVQVKRFVISR